MIQYQDSWTTQRRSAFARCRVSLGLVSALATAFGCEGAEVQTTNSATGGAREVGGALGGSASAQGGSVGSSSKGGTDVSSIGISRGGAAAGGQSSRTSVNATGGSTGGTSEVVTTGGKNSIGGARISAGGGSDRPTPGAGGASKVSSGNLGGGGTSTGAAASHAGDNAGSSPYAPGGRGGGGRSGSGAGRANAGASGGENAGASGIAGGTACASTLPAVTDYAAAGPFATTTESSSGPDGKCVIYRPKALGENGFLHAPIVFGPGIGMQASQLSGLLLSFASHGFVVIGTGVLNGGPNDPANKAAMQNALDWILKQNTQAGTYQGKLAVKCAVAMGYSVGGTAAVELGSHEAVATTVSIHGHVASSAMHGPLLQTSGDKDTVGRPMQQQTFDKSQVQTAFGTVSGADHGYIQSNNGGVERPAIIAWMRYWINGDTGARSYFWGGDCVLCKTPWMDYKTKNWQ